MQEVIRDDGEGKCSYAMGWWDTNIDDRQEKDKVIVFRWNGNEDNPKGVPTSNSYPIWIVLEDILYDSIIDTIATDEVSSAKIRKFLNLNTEDKKCLNISIELKNL